MKSKFKEYLDRCRERLNRVIVLDDDSLMPFGKYKYRPLGEVPDSYFRWFLSQDWCDDYPDLVEYANQVIDE